MVSEWTKEWMNGEHQIISLTWEDNVLFNLRLVLLRLPHMVFISTFRTWGKWSLMSRGFRSPALSNRVFALMCFSQKPFESQARTVTSHGRATAWCHTWTVIIYMLGKETLIWMLQQGCDTEWARWATDIIWIILNHTQETWCFQKLFILFINFS